MSLFLMVLLRIQRLRLLAWFHWNDAHVAAEILSLMGDRHKEDRDSIEETKLHTLLLLFKIQEALCVGI